MCTFFAPKFSTIQIFILYGIQHFFFPTLLSSCLPCHKTNFLLALYICLVRPDSFGSILTYSCHLFVLKTRTKNLVSLYSVLPSFQRNPGRCGFYRNQENRQFSFISSIPHTRNKPSMISHLQTSWPQPTLYLTEKYYQSSNNLHFSPFYFLFPF